eukprot:CAMPEP_0204242842 /NCGR_PEP_ID=MMETSP0361-20130328/96106_1 /ASSEMBLY_ACC=CAM_ASM_000343 /TAXON_ID=268821 /ORGANISM="Scrippsiella Hangoei, Strain SHTV-5" /LENGTH=426 /DNA_ID=CAMNT_0051215685 /DNA_START=113 /DNA_END=1393 /DNA_ORIENTATION=+
MASFAAALVAALAAALLPAALGKLESGVATLGTQEGDPRWHYVGKFGFAIGAGTYDVRLRLKGPPEMDTMSVNMEVYLDEDWDRVDTLSPCSRAFSTPARKTHVLRATDEWSPWMGGLLEQNVRPHIWYFALSKCTGHATNSTFEVDYELRSQQHDKSELSVEQRHMPGAIVLSVLCLSGFLMRFAMLCYRFHQRSGSVHPVIRTLAVSVLLQWTAQVLHLFHLFAYERNGVGEPSVDASADILFMLSQVVTCTLLLLIAQGYTLDQTKDTEWESIKPLAAVVALLHVVLVGHGKMQGDHAEKHHENEGVVGWAILLVRVVLYLWFAVGVGAQKRSGGFRLQPFLHRFHFAGSVYFLSYPAIFMITQVFAPYLRHPVMMIGLVLMQTAAAVWLSDLFLKRGSYYELSTLSSSLLPGSAGLSPRKED